MITYNLKRGIGLRTIIDYLDEQLFIQYKFRVPENTDHFPYGTMWQFQMDVYFQTSINPKEPAWAKIPLSRRLADKSSTD